MVVCPDDIIDGMIALTNGFCTVGRLYAIKVLISESIADMEQAASLFALNIDIAFRVDSFVVRYFHKGLGGVYWNPNTCVVEGGRLYEGRVRREDSESEIHAVELAIAGTVASLRESLAGSGLARPATRLLEDLQPALASVESIGTLPRLPSQPASRIPTKVLQGPARASVDPIFRESYSLLDRAAPAFSNRPEDAIPYTWVLATREVLAAQLCALSAIEYDGLPLAFYVDMAKQTWDEMRHAQCFLQAALKLLEEVEAAGDDGSELFNVIARHRKDGLGLPIPRERNLYEAMLNANLTERLVLMNHRTEAPAAASMHKMIDAPFCKAHPFIAAAYKFNRVDEISHALIGDRWLKYLCPDRAERESRIEDADLIRSVLILTSFCHHGGGDLLNLISSFSSANHPFQRDRNCADARYPS